MLAPWTPGLPHADATGMSEEPAMLPAALNDEATGMAPAAASEGAASQPSPQAIA